MITLHAGEKILLICRRHWLPIAGEAVSLAFAAFLPFLLLIASQILPASMQALINQESAALFLLIASWLLIIWMLFFVAWTNYYLDILILTDKRIIDINQIGLFARDISELRLEKIQDLKIEIIGFIPSLLNFGSLTIQTAGESSEFSIRNIHDPNAIKNLIAERHEALIRENRAV